MFNRARSIAAFITVVSLGVAGTASAQGIGVGVKGGVVFPTFSSDVLDWDTRTGWQAGVFVGGNRDGVVGVQGELNFLQKRAFSASGVVPATEVTVTYLQIPVLVRITATTGTCPDVPALVRIGCGSKTRYSRSGRAGDFTATARQSRILEHTRMNGRITRSEAAAFTGASNRSVSRDIARLVGFGRLVPDGRKGKAAGYRLT